MNIIFSFFFFLLISLSFHSNSSCEDLEKRPSKNQGLSPLSSKVCSHIDLTIEGALKDRFAGLSLKKRKADKFQGASKRFSPELPKDGEPS